jgi:two-component system, cell cycle sensor histidine kinase and response regulator CckA
LPENPSSTSNISQCGSAADRTHHEEYPPDLCQARAKMRNLIYELQPGQHPALQKAWEQLEAALTAKGEPTQPRARLVGPPCRASQPDQQGSRFPFFSSLLRNVLSTGGRPVDDAAPAHGGNAASQDASDLFHGNARGQDANDLFHSILDNTRDGAYRRNLRLNLYDYLSPALQRMTGIAPERFARMQMDELIALMHPDDRDRVGGEIREAYHQEQAMGVLEYRLLCADGEYRWLSDSYRMIKDAEGKPEYLVGNVRDITETKNALLSAKNSEDTLKALIELMPVGVCLVNFDGRLEYLNRFFLDTFGYDLSDIPTTKQWFLKAYPDPEYRAKVMAVFQAEAGATMANGAPVPLRETNVTCKDGSVRHVVFNRQLAQNYRVIILTDITEREKLQSELLKLRRLESLGVLAGGIAHDFNNILTGIMGNLSLARLLFDARDWSSELLESAESESLRAVRLAGQLLTFARGGTPVKKLLWVGNIVQDAVSLALGGANVKGVVTVPEALHAIEADGEQLGQAFSNIAINALQAMPEGGTLTVVAENLALGVGEKCALPPGNYLRLSFYDDGCGISPENQERVFDPYFSTKPGATGLGLATAHSIVTRHGGTLEVSSEPGKGACFTAVLPSTGAALAKPLPSKKVSSAAYAGGTILLMDDEKAIRNIASKMLECLSYQVTACCNGTEAISLFREAQESGSPYRIVILDLTVAGGMGGKEAARHLLALDPSACLVVSSGYSNDPVLADFKSYGFQASLPKPYKLSDMEAVLATVR